MQGAFRFHSQRLSVLFNILPQSIGQDLGIISDEDLSSIFIALKLPKHSGGHIAICAKLHITVLCVHATPANFCQTVRQYVIDLLQRLQR